MDAGEKIAEDLAVLPQRHGRIRFKNQFLHTFLSPAPPAPVLFAQADAFAGANAEEKASACSVRNEGGAGVGGGRLSRKSRTPPLHKRQERGTRRNNKRQSQKPVPPASKGKAALKAALGGKFSPALIQTRDAILRIYEF